MRQGVVWHDGTVTLRRGDTATSAVELHASLEACQAEHAGCLLGHTWSAAPADDERPRVFQLHRRVDWGDGVTGTGIVRRGIAGDAIVLRGVAWPDGTATVKWSTPAAHLEHWASVEACRRAHGREGGWIEWGWSREIVGKSVRIGTTAVAAFRVAATGTIVGASHARSYYVLPDSDRGDAEPLFLDHEQFEVV